MPTDQPTARQMLRAAIERSGLSTTRYASRVLLRNPRTLRRWVAGDSPIPAEVIGFLERRQKPSVTVKINGQDTELIAFP